MLLSSTHQTLFQVVVQTAADNGFRAYLVGGVVRDLLLGKPALDEDIDLLIEGNALSFAETLQQQVGGDLKKFEAFYTAKIIAPNERFACHEIDLASSRTEVYLRPGALPQVSLAPLKEDLRRRDFSVNAVAIAIEDLLAEAESDSWQSSRLKEKCIDHFNGLSDLNSRTLRVLHERSFLDDPTRIFRLARYIVRLNGQVETNTATLLGEAVSSGAISTISFQRVLNEIKKIFEERTPLLALTFLEQSGALACLTRLTEIAPSELLARLDRSAGYLNSLPFSERFWWFLLNLVDERGVQVWSEKLIQLGLKKKEVQQRAMLLQAVNGAAPEGMEQAWRQLRLAFNLDRCC